MNTAIQIIQMTDIAFDRGEREGRGILAKLTSTNGGSESIRSTIDWLLEDGRRSVQGHDPKFCKMACKELMILAAQWLPRSASKAERIKLAQEIVAELGKH